MKLSRFLILLVNLFNVLDCLTTIYGVKILGFYEINVFARAMINCSPFCYVLVKLNSIAFLSYIFYKISNTEMCKPIVTGMRVGFTIGFVCAGFILFMASLLNLLQIIGYDVSDFLFFVVKIVPK